MKRRMSILILSCVLSGYSAISQEKEITHQSQYWLKYSFHLPMDNWQVKGLVEDRRFLPTHRQHMWLYYLGGSYKLPKGFTVGTGLLYWLIDTPSDPYADYTFVDHEWRPSQYLSYKKRGLKSSISGRVLVEERFRKNSIASSDGSRQFQKGYYLYYRPRFKVQWEYMFLEQIGVFVSNEYMIHFGDERLANLFDQNRATLGAKVKFSKNFTFSLAYLNWYQRKKSLQEDYYARDIITLAVAHRLQLK